MSIALTNEQKAEFMKKFDIDTLNIIVSAYLGTDIKLKIICDTNIVNGFQKSLHYSLEDKHNLRDECGLWRFAVKEIHLETFCFFISLNDETQEIEASFELHFIYTHTEGGSNGCKACSMYTRNGKFFIRN